MKEIYSLRVIAKGCLLLHIFLHESRAFVPLPVSHHHSSIAPPSISVSIIPPNNVNGNVNVNGRHQHVKALNAMNLLTDLNMEDLIYKAQSTASSLADSTLTMKTDSPASATSASSLAVLYFAGLLTSFSPCSLGLLPLTVSYISNAAGEREDKAVFLPTVAFACGLAAVFCGLGLSVSLLGGVFGSTNSGGDNFWATFALAAFSSGISIAMGLQLLDLVNLPLPNLEFAEFSSSLVSGASGVEQDLSSEIDIDEDGNIIMKEPPTPSIPTSGGASGGASSALFRTFLLGGSSALVASPCATPVLTSILAFVAANRDPALGGILLLTYTIGYSTPLLVVGASGGQALANAQVASMSEEESVFGKIGALVNPITASILIWYGTNGFLVALLGDPSLAGLAPILE